MLSKLKNIFIIFIAFCFSFTALSAKENKKPKIKNFYLKNTSRQKKKRKQKRKNRIYSKKKNIVSSKTKSNVKTFKTEIFNENKSENLGCDYELAEIELFSKFTSSKFGYDISLQSQKLLTTLEEMYELGMSDLDIDETQVFDLKEECIKDIKSLFTDIRKVNSVNTFLYLNDIAAAELAACNIDNDFLKNLGLELLFNNYIIKKDLQKAHKIYSLMIFDEDDEDVDEDYYYYARILIRAYMQNKDIVSAEKLAFSLKDKDKLEIENILIQLVKYYTRLNDVENAKRIVDRISSDYFKNEAKVYLLDYFARKENIVEFQKIALLSDNMEFQEAAKFILNIYQNNIKEALENKSGHYELVLENIIEILCSSNRIKEAEDFLDIYGDEFDKEDYNFFFINEYLKNKNFEEAKRIRDEIDYDPIDKWLATKLISICMNE